MNPKRHIPTATYRVQLVPGFGFADLARAVPYLQRLGISHLYLSPVFRSRPGSQHGYDVTDHTSLNPELGTREAFTDLATTCRAHGLGMVLDIVPNHMAVMSPDNHWWMDVLEHGPASVFADYFDIDWTPGRASMRNRLLVPFLGKPLGEVLEAGELTIVFDAQTGGFSVCYAEHRLPLDPRSTVYVLGPRTQAAAGDQESPAALQPLLQEFSALPGTAFRSAEASARRAADAQSCKQRLAALVQDDPVVAQWVEACLARINQPLVADGESALAQLLDMQPYRLAYWRIAGEEINYRRFFDVNELAALRMENPAVFRHAHALLLELWQQGCIDGVRIDHADGLYAPAQYLSQLETLLGERPDGQRPYLVVEKILEGNEQLPADWPVHGTTGYEFGALLTGWLMHPQGSQQLERTHRRFVGAGPGYTAIVYDSKKRVMQTSLASEISMLAGRLDRIAQMSHATTDFTLFDLRQAIAEYIACFPVYRTYAAEDGVGDHDAGLIRRTLGAASSRRQTLRRTLDFLGAVLLGDAQGPARRDLAMRDFRLRLQQVTGPVMAKGVEDTSFYRYTPLLPMNEVGGDPQCRGVSTERLHKANAQRASAFPHTLLATSTHDSKRGEDVRYRLCVLGELAASWGQALSRWRRLKRRGRDHGLPAAELEYLLLQTALGIWPDGPSPAEIEALRARLAEYAIKAAREAKDITSWLDPDSEYEDLLGRYAQTLVPSQGEGGFGSYFAPLLAPVRYFGMLNALASTAIKLTVPGVPDIYQGNELPRYVLVDPDNRGIVDMAGLSTRLAHLEARIAASSLLQVSDAVLAQWPDGDIKLLVTARLLALRRAQPDTFLDGAYLPLPAAGARADHVVGFARVSEQGSVLVLAARWTATLQAGNPAPLERATWSDTRVELPAGVPAGFYTDAMTGGQVTIPDAQQGPRFLAMSARLAPWPFCVLSRSGEQS